MMQQPNIGGNMSHMFRIFITTVRSGAGYIMGFKLVDDDVGKVVVLSTIYLDEPSISENLADLVAVFSALRGFILFKRERMNHLLHNISLVVCIKNRLIVDIFEKNKKVHADHLAEWVSRTNEKIRILKGEGVVNIIFNCESDYECEKLVRMEGIDDHDTTVPEERKLRIVG